jgi:hypothetical protein
MMGRWEMIRKRLAPRVLDIHADKFWTSRETYSCICSTTVLLEIATDIKWVEISFNLKRLSRNDIQSRKFRDWHN